MRKTKVLYIDFDGTLTTDRYWCSLPVDKYEEVQQLLFGVDKILVNGWMRGRYLAEEVNEYLSITLDVQYSYLWKLFVSDCRGVFIPNDILRTINQLRENYVVVLVADNMDSFMRFTVPALDLNRYFDTIICSYYEGRYKTDFNGRFFSEQETETKILLSNSLLIDDQDLCCDIFTSLGGTSHKTTAVDQTREILQGLL